MSESPPYWRRLLPILAVTLCVIGVAVWASGRPAVPVGFDYRIVKSYPHDRSAYCQGLVYEDGVLYEGTGRYGESTLRQVDLASGRVQRQVALDRSIFGEGITVWNDSIVQLSWKENVAFIYDKRTFAQTGKFRYTGEGWGITHDNRHWIVSDGSPTLRFFDPQTFQVVRRVTVRDGDRRVRYLNELEYIQGEIWANVWYQDYLVRISPQTGNVLGYLDLSRLWPIHERPDREAVLNGIAFDPATGHLLVTGKNWPRLFELELIPRR